jgi:hypothetical protein
MAASGALFKRFHESMSARSTSLRAAVDAGAAAVLGTAAGAGCGAADEEPGGGLGYGAPGGAKEGTAEAWGAGAAGMRENAAAYALSTLSALWTLALSFAGAGACAAGATGLEGAVSWMGKLPSRDRFSSRRDITGV